ncbi:1133_t:CDS:2 [Ambispora leptoticha]|uniref:1133_t:CDS:1 n=1 Tax=Ambispora leptoticha TaxID=144679 RepID=A0A9N9FTG1_9GLOM|nr:1133_t:CDS:2 [Ambispora leptoticha]
MFPQSRLQFCQPVTHQRDGSHSRMKTPFYADTSLVDPTPGISIDSSQTTKVRSQSCFLKENETEEEEASYLWRLGIWPKGTTTNPDHLATMLIGYKTTYELSRGITKRIVNYTLDLFRVINRDEDSENLELISTRSEPCGKFFFGRDRNYHNRFLTFAKFDDIFGNCVKRNESDEESVDLILRVRFEQVCRGNIENESINNQHHHSSLNNNKMLYSTIAPPQNNSQLPRQSSDYLDDETFCDVEFILDCGLRIKAHRLVLGTASAYFKTLFTGGFLESSLSTIPIKDITYSSFQAMINYLYTGNLKQNLSFETLFEIHSKADMMGIDNLQKAVESRLKCLGKSKDWDQVLMFAWRIGNVTLKRVALEYVSDNWEEVRKSVNWRDVVACGEQELVDEVYSASFFGVK